MSYNLQPNSSINTYCCKTLQANWYEERCVSNWDKTNNKKIMLDNPSSWMYEKTSNELGIKHSEHPILKVLFE